MSTERPLGILALDGGGVRGLSELIILKNILGRLQYSEQQCDSTQGQRYSDSPPELWRYFDLICETSNGGLLALMLDRLRMAGLYILCFTDLSSPSKIGRTHILLYRDMFSASNAVGRVSIARNIWRKN